MIKNNAEFFALVDEVVALLTNSGHQSFAHRLKNAKSVSAMPGEIFGEIGLVLKEIEKTLPGPNQIERPVRRLLDAIKSL